MLISSLLCSFVAYAGKRNGVRGMCIYVLFQTIILLISLTLEEDGIISLIIVGVCAFAINKLCGVNKSEKDVVDVEIKYNEKLVKLRALKDTGNFLVDPLTGHSVILIGADAAKTLTGLDKDQISDPISAVSENIFPGLRLLPFRTIGKSNGMLLACKFKDVKIGNEQGSRLVAFVPNELTGNCRYQALTGGRI